MKKRNRKKDALKGMFACLVGLGICLFSPNDASYFALLAPVLAAIDAIIPIYIIGGGSFEGNDLL